MLRMPKSGSNLVAAGILLSRIAGLVREQVIVATLGASKSASAFRFAMRIPNLLQNLLGEGALSASFIPVYANLIEKGDQAKASKLARAVVSWLVVITSLVVVTFVVAARPIVALFTSWESDQALYDQATQLVQITSIGIGFLVVSAWCLGVLNSHRRFFLSYVAPVLWNFAQITALLIAIALSLSLEDSATWLAVAVVAGGVAQLLIQLFPTLGLIGSGEDKVDISAELKDVATRFVPAVGARGVVQISSYIDTFLAAAIAVSALPLYTASLPLYLLPISLFGFSIAASELAEMSRISHDKETVAQRFSNATNKVLVPAGFVTALYIGASVAVVDGLYGIPVRLKDWIAGSSSEAIFGQDQIIVVALILSAFALGLPAAMNARITQNTLYSLGDVKGPARIAVARVLLVLCISSLLMLQFDWLQIADGTMGTVPNVPDLPTLERLPEEIRLDDSQPPKLGPVGLALGASIASWTELLLLRRRLKTTQGITALANRRPILLAGLGCLLVMSVFGNLPWLPSPIDLALALALGGASYYLILKRSGIDAVGVLRS